MLIKFSLKFVTGWSILSYAQTPHNSLSGILIRYDHQSKHGSARFCADFTVKGIVSIYMFRRNVVSWYHGQIMDIAKGCRTGEV